MTEKEFSLDELDNVLGGIPSEVGIENVLEHEELYRKKQLEELKREKDNAREHEKTNRKEFIEELKQTKEYLEKTKEQNSGKNR